MAYRLERGESVQAGIVRVVGEELEGAIAQLTEAQDDRVTAVHEARKHVKKARSALRLVRGELGRKTYRRENERLRQAARRLSGVRDAQVAVTTLDRLRESGEDSVPPDVWAEVRRVLDDRRRAAGDELLGAGGFVTEVAADLAKARDRVGGLALDRGGWKALRGGLAREYGRGADARAKAARTPDVEDLHAWRRRVKDSWYHVRLLESAWPVPLGDLAEEAHRLSELLGDDHDLANLGATLTGEPDAFGVELSGLVRLVDQRRAQLQQRARRLGDRLYAESPGAYVRRLGAYWRAWRSEDQVDAGTDDRGEAPPAVAEPRLTATPGAVERPAVAASALSRPPEPLLSRPDLGSVERAAFRAPVARTVSEPQLPRPPITARPKGSAAAAPAAEGEPAGAVMMVADEPDTVYAAKGGRRYHRPTCLLAGPNAQPLSRTAAEAASLAPCGSCRP